MEPKTDPMKLTTTDPKKLTNLYQVNCYKYNATYNIQSEIQVTTDPVNYNRPNKTK